ncbi:MAG: hypothetical protein GYB64_12330, partial [Chloroflexi bacterium]|nr:hypothetical protein [Chloroflexota bacterium]
MHHIMEIANRIGLRKYSTVKYGFDLVLWAAAAPLAFILRLDNTLGWWPSILIYTGIGTVIKAALILGFGLYRQSWHKVGVRDLLTLLQTVGLG